MNFAEAEALYQTQAKTLRPTRSPRLNKQGKEKKTPTYLSGLVDALVEKAVGADFDHDPQKLTTFTKDGIPVRTFVRRVDGAYPSTVNPIAIWEIKEYYHTTSFGSRVADGIYVAVLDGMEIESYRQETGVKVLNYLIVDGKNTWWDRGKSYLCRIIDMLHMGHVDEVFFGREIVKELPKAVRAWKQIRKADKERR